MLGSARSDRRSAAEGHRRRKRGAGLISAALFGFGAAATDLVAVTRAESLILGLVLAALGIIQLVVVVAALARPARRVLLAAGTISLAIVAFWAVSRWSGVPFGPSLWLAQDRLAGSNDFVVAFVRLVGAMLFLLVGLRWPRLRLRRAVWIALAILPSLLLAGVLTAATMSMVVLSHGPTPAQTSSVSAPAAGQKTTLNYCSPDGAGLAMDLYEPSAAQATGGGGSPAPVVLYVHGGMWLYGDSTSEGDYFRQVQTQLNQRGFVVASIDYRLSALYHVPAQIEDAKCAVRFLRANANALGIDPDRIGAWGASSGGTSTALLGMGGTPAAWDAGQYEEQSSRVRAVVDFSGPADFTQMGSSYGASPSGALLGSIIRASWYGRGTAPASISPVADVGPGDPPFFIVHGTQDPIVPAGQSQELAQRLQAAGASVKLVTVEGAGHVGIDPLLSEQIPAAVDFLSSSLTTQSRGT